MTGLEINVIANSMVEPGGMSGGNRIFIELVKRWMNEGANVTIFTSECGRETCKVSGLENANFYSWNSSRYSKFGIIALYLLGTLQGILAAIRKTRGAEKTIVLSTSDFWPDVIPGFLMHKLARGSLWVSSFQLFMPSPLSRYFPYSRWNCKGLIYYFSQRLSYLLVNKYADMVIVFGEYDVDKFITQKRKRERVIAVGGGVDTKLPLSAPTEKQAYDAVFMGRLHPQKGVRELIDIWKLVCRKRNNARLAIIGHGELEKEIRERITNLKLEDNISLLGFKSGLDKIKIFKGSRLMLYPAILDHWSISPIEGMICGLPLITFDLPVLEFYPTARGMMKVPPFDLAKFADSINMLLDDIGLYTKMQKEAVEWAKEWDWDRRTGDILKIIEGDLKNQ